MPFHHDDVPRSMTAPKPIRRPSPRSSRPSGISRLSAAAALLAAGGLASCDDKPRSQSFEIAIHVESDPGMALAGATVVRNGRDLVATDTQGRTRLVLEGFEGDTVDFMVRCPPDFQSPTKPIGVVLHRLADKGRLPEYSALCPPTTRKIVVAVRAENGPFLPVTYLGKTVARTDAAGAAHVLLAMKPGDQFELGLDTSENQQLRPENPTKDFVVRPKDEIQGFEVRFTKEPLKRKYHGPARPTSLGSAGDVEVDNGQSGPILTGD